MTPEKKIEILELALEKANNLMCFQRMKMKQARIWTTPLEESFNQFKYAYTASQEIDEELSAWRQMDNLTWLDYVTRNIHLVRSNGESEDEDMLICDVALHGFYTVTIKAHSFLDLILKGQEHEQTALARPIPPQKGETDGQD